MLDVVYSALCEELSIGVARKTDQIYILHRDKVSVTVKIGGEKIEFPIFELQKNLAPKTSCFLLDCVTGVVAFYNANNVTFCPECLLSKIRIYEEYVGACDEQAELEDIHFLIPVLMDVSHGIPLATGFHDTDQNWSILTPLPSCALCSKREKRARISLVATAIPDINLVDNNDLLEGESDETLAEKFVNRNRWAIGFGSILGNILVEDDPCFPVTYACNFCDTETVQIASGKGVSISRAIAGCIGEAIERYFLDGSFSSSSSDVSTPIFLGKYPKVDLVNDFGFPYQDRAAPFAPQHLDVQLIEWSPVTVLTGNSGVALMPTNFVYCPYRAVEEAEHITMSSTNGAAAGRSVEHATLSALLECVERDAFAYYSRLDVSPVGILRASWPSLVESYQNSHPDLRMAVTVLPSPFNGVHIAQVTMHNSLDEAPKTVRGTGAAFSEESAIIRAASECVQMYYSLKETSDDPNAADDMREIWRSGEAKSLWPEYFSPKNNRNMVVGGASINARAGVAQIISEARRQGISVYSHIVYKTDYLCVVKCVFSSACVADASYFKGNSRFHDFASLIGHEHREVTYSGPLFM